MTPPDCTHVQARLEDLLDGYLSADAAGPVRAHLATCAACTQEMRELEALQTALRELPAPALR
ncbi:MAG: anti-sigma factor family protein, partial [Gammaproteobacteria bacterium]